MTETRTIKVEALTRVEGEGALNISMNGDVVEKVELAIYEPPRFFEAFLRDRSIEEVPDITARICGICPVAYQVTSVHAIEAALEIQIPEEIRALRRLLYFGEWIESHALHMHLLNAPDFFGVESGIQLAKQFPNEVTRGLQLKKHGNELLEVLGGRAIHPINVAVGGLYRIPKKDEMQKLIPAFEWGLEAAIEATRWVSNFEFPEFERDYEMVALSDPDDYAIIGGKIVSTSGLSLPIENYEDHFEEYQVHYSTALQSRNQASESTSTHYYVGPLARINHNRNQLSPIAKEVADEINFDTPCINPFKAIIARGLEVIHSFEESLKTIKDYRPFQPPKVEYEHCIGKGVAATEAPRGLIFHRYKINENGKVDFAKIVPPTSQNQKQIEEDLKEYLPTILSSDDRETAMNCEKLIRCYDPCISCSTHFLTLNLDRK